MKRGHPRPDTYAGSENGEPSSSVAKRKLWIGEDEAGGGMDELLAVLGYKVRSSDMAEVAQKLEQLEMLLGTAQDDGISHLSTDTIHYNPSDLSGWLQNMLSELNNSPGIQNQPQPQAQDQSQYQGERHDSTSFAGFGGDDLRAIPGVAAYPSPPPPPAAVKLEISDGNSVAGDRTKRMRFSTTCSSSMSSSSSPAQSGSELTRTVVLIDAQEAGVRLVHTLLACAEAVQQENLKLADALVKHVGLLAASQPGAMRKVATYFAEALARRIYQVCPQDSVDPSYSDTLEMHFYESCPYLKFAHFTANQAILEAFASAGRVHVIDFGLKQGMQWPALMQALALRPGGPPAFRLTGIGPPQLNNTDTLQQVGWKLAQLAETIGVEFEFHWIVAKSLADIELEMFDIQQSKGEVVAVNSVFELHRLLARPGAIDKVLTLVKAMRPKIVTIVEHEANHNGTVFLDRFTESLHYYSSLFDSLEGSSGSIAPQESEDLLMSELYLGRQICNVVACEGADRVERHETLTQWRGRMKSAGFDPVLLGSNAFRQASMLLALYAGGDGYRVEERNGCLMLGWHTRPLIATSAWQIVGSG